MARARRKKKPVYDMFTNTSVDLPLFSGTAQRATESTFKLEEQGVTPVLPGMEEAYALQFKRKIDPGGSNALIPD